MSNPNDLSQWGPVEKYSPGTAAIMADRQIRRGMKNGTVRLDDLGNGMTTVTLCATGQWFTMPGGWGNDHVPTAMMGAVCGDVAGSVYEWNNIKHKLASEQLIHPQARFTDDTVMTCAVAEGIRTGLSQLPDTWLAVPEAEDVLEAAIRSSILRYGRKYPDAGYGGAFRRWMASEDPQPYNSWGNGSAMRASCAGWAARTLEEAEKLAEISARVTHNHPEGVKGAVVVAGCIFLLRTGATRQDVAAYAGRFYDLDFTMDGIRADYAFDVSCAGSVPQGIRAFLEGADFADTLALAISIGGDSDTIAAIAGSLAEVICPIPQDLRGAVIDRLDDFLLSAIAEAVDFMACRQRG